MSAIAVTVGDQRHTFSAASTVVVTVGRDPSCDVVLADARVSRTHLRLTRNGAVWVVTGVGRGGTFLAGQPISSLVVTGPLDLALGAPGGGPIIRIEPASAVIVGNCTEWTTWPP